MSQNPAPRNQEILDKFGTDLHSQLCAAYPLNDQTQLIVTHSASEVRAFNTIQDGDLPVQPFHANGKLYFVGFSLRYNGLVIIEKVSPTEIGADPAIHSRVITV